MSRPKIWTTQRVVTLLIVAALHAAMLSALLVAAGIRAGNSGAEVPIEVLLLPPPPLPRVRISAFRADRLSVDPAFSVKLPELGVLSPEPPASAAAGHGLGVDWNAEAHRAVRAYEIRREQSLHSSNPGSTQADDWYLFHGHHAGDRFKTENGDWIVWINSNCYQVASWHAGAPERLSNAAPQTVCDTPPTH